MNILFVCTGNTCRSPMAEGYLRAKNIKNISVSSCGLAADGLGASENAVAVMKEIGIDISCHISSQVTYKDIETAHKVICLAKSHKEALENAGVPSEKLFVLGEGILDPYGCDIETYRNCRDQIIKEIDALFNDFTVESATENDLETIAELEKICFSEPWSKSGLEESLNTGTRFFTAKKNGEILGYAGVKFVLDEGYITNVAVFPQFRKSGVATAIMEKLLKTAIKEKISFVTLEVRKSNQNAISLYEKLGFKTEGERRDFYTNPKENALIMTKRFEVNDNT